MNKLLHTVHSPKIGSELKQQKGTNQKARMSLRREGGSFWGAMRAHSMCSIGFSLAITHHRYHNYF